MAKQIALFNHKGGVGKTTTTFNLGWMLGNKGKKVIIVDSDPQCNLTGMGAGIQGCRGIRINVFLNQFINRINKIMGFPMDLTRIKSKISP